MEFEITANLEGTLDIAECISHRANSLEDAHAKLKLCNDDFMFFPMSSINSNLTEVNNLFDRIDVNTFKNLQFFLRENNTHYFSPSFEHENEVALDPYYSKNITLFIKDTILNSHLYIREFSETLGYYGVKFCDLILAPESVSQGVKWHFDEPFGPYNILVPLTDPGTEFCSIAYDQESYSKLDKNTKNELSFNKCNGSYYQSEPDEAVIFKINKAFHKAPSYFNGGRALIKFSVGIMKD